MPIRQFLCDNYGENCPKAHSNEKIELQSGEEENCPSCHKKLVSAPPLSSSRWKWFSAAAAALAAVGLALFAGYRASKHVDTGHLPSIPTGPPGPQTISSCKLVALDKDDATRVFGYVKSGMSYASQDKLPDALEDFTKAIAIDPHQLSLRTDRAAAEIPLRKFREAEDDLSAELTTASCLSEPTVTDAQLASLAYYEDVKANTPEETVRLKAAAMRKQIESTRAAAHYNLACLYSVQEDDAKSIDELRQAVHDGFSSRTTLETDPTLSYVRGSPEFRKVLAAMP